MWALCVLAIAFGGDVLVRQDRRLLDAEVIAAQARAGHRPLGITSIVAPPPGPTDDVWVLGGGVTSLSSRRLRALDGGVALATWLEDPANLVVLADWSPRQAFLMSEGVTYDRLFVPFLPATLGGPSAAPVTGPTCGACGAHAYCKADGDATGVCACHAGFEPLSPGPGCSDVDECAADACGPDATCTDLDGGFLCDCVEGHEWVGDVCTPIDECARGTDTCDPVATCIDTPESYGCDCPDGYDGDGHVCVEIDECAEGSDQCDVAATCTNTTGSYTCACPDGWTTEGFDCTPPEGMPDCGDGQVEGTEECDDFDEDSGDGCSSTCTVEDGWVCSGAACLPDRDSDGVVDEDDVCPEIYDPDQTDSDGDGTGDACEGDTGDTADTGGPDDSDRPRDPPGSCGCDTPFTPSAAWALLALAAAVRRRR